MSDCNDFLDHRFIHPAPYMNYVICRRCGDEVDVGEDEYVGTDGGLYGK